MNKDTCYFYEQMLTRYSTLTGFTPDEASDTAIRFQLLAQQLATLCGTADEAANQAFPASATGDALDTHAQTRGLTRKAAAHAAGTLVFTRATEAGEVALPAGMLCGTSDGAEYETTQATVIPDGSLTANVPARAVKAGAWGNAAAKQINRPRRIYPGVAGVDNPAPFTGGCDAEEDEALRRRLLAAYGARDNGANGAYYRRVAEEFEGVSSATAAAGQNAGEIIVSVAADGARSIPDTVKTALKALLDANREPCATVTVRDATAVAVNVAVAVEPAAGHASQAVYDALTARLTDLLDRMAVGQRLTLARLGQLVMDSGLVQNYRFLAPSADVSANLSQVIRPAAINVAGMGANG